jgi:hypothetical protein
MQIISAKSKALEKNQTGVVSKVQNHPKPATIKNIPTGGNVEIAGKHL